MKNPVGNLIALRLANMYPFHGDNCQMDIPLTSSFSFLFFLLILKFYFGIGKPPIR